MWEPFETKQARISLKSFFEKFTLEACRKDKISQYKEQFHSNPRSRDIHYTLDNT